MNSRNVFLSYLDFFPHEFVWLIMSLHSSLHHTKYKYPNNVFFWAKTVLRTYYEGRQ